jgi:hypothetical protein
MWLGRGGRVCGEGFDRRLGQPGTFDLSQRPLIQNTIEPLREDTRFVRFVGL